MQSLPTSQWCPCCLWQHWRESIRYKDTNPGLQGAVGGSKLPRMMTSLPPHSLQGIMAPGIVLGTFSQSFHSSCNFADFFGTIQHHDYKNCYSFLFVWKGQVSSLPPFSSCWDGWRQNQLALLTRVFQETIWKLKSLYDSVTLQPLQCLLEHFL